MPSVAPDRAVYAVAADDVTVSPARSSANESAALALRHLARWGPLRPDGYLEHKAHSSRALQEMSMSGLPQKRSFGVFLKDVLLFLVAPFITIAYLALFPFIGLAELVRAKSRKHKQA
jgi:hypothetical protein